MSAVTMTMVSVCVNLYQTDIYNVHVSQLFNTVIKIHCVNETYILTQQPQLVSDETLAIIMVNLRNFSVVAI